ncbi:MAG: IS6 family transposase [Oligoflexia bacterium]|nr:IS6 family transposase [Oligoflexia bacterium]
MAHMNRSPFSNDIILLAIHWYLRYALSYRDLEEILEERGIEVDHSTINRWVKRYTPDIEKNFRKRKRPTGGSWRMDETYVKVKGVWKYLYRAVDKEGNTIDFLLTSKRDTAAAHRFFKKAINNNGVPDKINIDKSGANKAGIQTYNERNGFNIEIRECKYLNNIVEQDHRFIKKIIRPMLGFKNFNYARITLAGIEIVRMIKKGQLCLENSANLTVAEQFYSLAF